MSHNFSERQRYLVEQQIRAHIETLIINLAKAVNARRSHHSHRFYSHTVLLGRTERVNERKQTYTTHKAVLIGYTDEDCGDWDIILESADHWQPIQAIEDLWSKTQGRMDGILAKMKKKDIKEYSEFKGDVSSDSEESDDRPAGTLGGEEEG